MEFASSNITSPEQSTAFCRILFNFLYRSVQGTHSTDFKSLQLDNTNPQAMIMELASLCAPSSKASTAPLPLVSDQSPLRKKVKPSLPTPFPPKAVTSSPPSSKPKDVLSRPPTAVTSQSSGVPPSHSAHHWLRRHQASHTTRGLSHKGMYLTPLAGSMIKATDFGPDLILGFN
jgi:hypothetical protein